MTERNCPRCNQQLSVGRMGPLELDICFPCTSVWFDCGELSRVMSAGPDVVQRLADRIQAPGGAPAIRSMGPPQCPACRIMLENVDFANMPGVRLDGCRFCEGHWVTRNGLHRLSAALRGASEWHQIATEQPTGGPAPGAFPPIPPPGAAPAPPGFGGLAPGFGAPPQAPAAYPAPAGYATAGPPMPPAGYGTPPAGYTTPPTGNGPPAGGYPSTAHTAVPAAPAAPPRAPAAPAAPLVTPSSPLPAGMIHCPHCGEGNSERAAVCWACGQPFQGPVVGACPYCEAGMRRITADAVTFNACEGCAAVYITPNRLNQLLLLNTQAQERVLRQVDRASPDRMRRRNTMLNCPECRIVMFLSPMGVISKEPVHTCTRCFGLFLAPGKLGMILSGRR